jgi:glycosyltransferase involved in cell wall biosynthesis
MNSRLPKLSVDMPLFGGADYLKSPIRCRLEQDLDAFQLILVVSNSD